MPTRIIATITTTIIILIITVFAVLAPTINIIIGGILINNGGECLFRPTLNVLDAVFLANQHIQTNHPQKGQNFYVLKEALNISKKRSFPQQSGRWFYVNRPLNTHLNQKNAFESILTLSPNTNRNLNNNNNQLINNINFNLSSNATSSKNGNNIKNNINSLNSQQYEVNMTANNKQYDILMNDQYVNILSFIIRQNLNLPIYLKNRFITTLNPEQISMSNGAKQIMFEENAGGCSELSEGFSFEVLRKLFGAKLLKTEMAIKYWWPHWKKTDYSIKMNDAKIGVSVTRAMKYSGLFNKNDAIKLLTKKLRGINESSNGVLECDEWQRQILHIWTTDEYIEKILHRTFLDLLFRKHELVKNTLVIVTVASEDMWWIFYQDKYFKKRNNKNKVKKKVIKKNMLLTAIT